jgi:PAS domain-containing protein
VKAVTAALEAVPTGGTVVSTYRALLPDGTQRRLLARGRALVDADGTSTGVLGAVVDVTDLEVAVAARARSAETLARLAEVAMQLAAARTVEDLVRVVVEHVLSVLGTDGGAVCVRDDERDIVQMSVSESLPERSASPATRGGTAARSGRRPTGIGG